MEVNFFINMTFIFVVNVSFLLSGICLNSLVILSFWRSALLRKKTCHFMIMVLSCFDLLAVLTNHPLMALLAVLRLTGKLHVCPGWVDISVNQSNNFLGFSLLALLVMNFDRYLAASYPIFHRATVTKAKLLTLLAILIAIQVTLGVICVNDFVLSYQNGLLIFLIIVSLPMLFINCRLFIIARRRRRNNALSPEMKTTFSLKNLSSCLLAVACFVVLSIPAFVYIGLKTTSKVKTFTFDNADLVGIWGKTIATMNSTFNCLIFYWKNKIMRTEGMKMIKSLKIDRVQS